MEWYDFGEIYIKYRCAETTNSVENPHSVKRKYVEKRLNFSVSYTCRSNIAVLNVYLKN